MMDCIEIRRKNEEVIYIYYHYYKFLIVILDKDTIIRYALSETQRLKLNANQFYTTLN